MASNAENVSIWWRHRVVGYNNGNDANDYKDYDLKSYSMQNDYRYGLISVSCVDIL